MELAIDSVRFAILKLLNKREPVQKTHTKQKIILASVIGLRDKMSMYLYYFVVGSQIVTPLAPCCVGTAERPTS